MARLIVPMATNPEVIKEASLKHDMLIIISK